MKITIEVNGKPVEIELTTDQIKTIKGKITDRVKTFEDACKVLGYAIPKSMHVTDKLKTIATVLNEGWTPDWNNSAQYKYVPYFRWNGTAFVSGGSYGWSGSSDVGSRLCFRSSELAKYAAEQFIDLYNEFLQ
jgi:hypothetical protein